MSIDLQNNIKIHQQLLITPQLQQAIKILQFSKLELESFLNDQLINNPTLEDQDESILDNEFEKKEENTQEPVDTVFQQKDSQVDKNSQESLDKLYPSEPETSFQKSYTSLEKSSFNYEEIIGKQKNLKEHLLDQINFFSLCEKNKKIAFLLIDAIDDTGYLQGTENLSQEENILEKDIEKIIRLVQTLDPTGVGARSLGECLLIQLESYDLKTPLLEKIIHKHLNSLAKKNYKLICQDLKITSKELQKNLNIILSLESQPGKIFSSELPHYITPDVYINKTPSGWTISLEKIRNGNLSVNPYYRQLAQVAKGKKEEKHYLKEKIKEAKWLIKSLEQREKTLVKVMRAILKKQTPFFSHGKEYLKPLVLKEIAQETNLHESTISRITTNKYVQTEQGLLELRSFFNSSLNSSKGSPISSSVVKIFIKKMIKEEEDNRKPFSDSKIQEKLKEKGIDIARRTVTKYREQLGLLSSNRRTRYD